MSEEDKADIFKKWGWFLGAVLTATGLQWQFPELRGGAFTDQDHKPWEERIVAIERKVNHLPPQYLLEDVATMKGDIKYMSKMIEQIQLDIRNEHK